MIAHKTTLGYPQLTGYAPLALGKQIPFQWRCGGLSLEGGQQLAHLQAFLRPQDVARFVLDAQPHLACFPEQTRSEQMVK